MKNFTSKILLTASIGICATLANAQTVSTFESLTLNANSYWNGSGENLKNIFKSGNADFYNAYDTAFGGFWKSGWAYSNMKDTTTAGFGNLYSAIAGTGADGSSIYTIGQQNAAVGLRGKAKGEVVNGVSITNSTYATLSMRIGDQFAKKFGGASGNDPDFFLLTVYGYLNSAKVKDSVNFYLADFRNTDNSKDYILNTWKYVNLKPLGKVDSLVFHVSSSDNGIYGMNTPAFFALDNLVTSDGIISSIANLQQKPSITAYPNPVANLLHIENVANDEIINVKSLQGHTVIAPTQLSNNSLDVNSLPQGIYILQCKHSGQMLKFVKQ